MLRKWRWRVLAIVGLPALVWGTYCVAASWWSSAELARASREIANGQFGPARERLTQLLAIRPNEAEVPYRLGLCEQAAGRPEAALAAWSRIEAGSPFAALATRDRDRMLRRYLDRGQFSALEDLLERARHGRGPDAAELGQALARLLRYQGRFDEVKRLLQEEWSRSSDPSRTLRDLWMLDADPVPIALVRDVLDRAAQQSPDDDRVWLGRANLATWSGDFEEADRWLTACLRRRPRDPAVWQARLDWSRAAGRVDTARQALAQLPADRLDPAKVFDLRAWFAADQGDRRAERQALEALIEQAPGNTQALEQLATLAFEDGQTDRAIELRRRKDYLDRSRDLYRKLLAIDASTIDLPTVARLAESLGRWFEARGWWTLVVRFSPNHAEAHAALDRLARRTASRSSDRSPADLIAAPDHVSPSSLPPSTIRLPNFSDDAEVVGLRFTYDHGPTESRHLPETMGGGVGLLDFDGDGWLDVYCIQGGAFPPSGANGDRLFRNRGDGTFEDRTEQAGLAALPGSYGHGVAVGDFDNDGWPDLFLTRWRSYTLYRNQGDGTFEDVTESAGLGGDRDWPTSAAWADLDQDGDLDLYVSHYLAYDIEHPALCDRSDRTAGHEYCDPRKFPSLPDHLFRNDGGRFVDVTDAAGLVDRDGRGLGVVAADLDGDGRVDLYVANDTTANFLFRNLGGFRFEDVGIPSGVAASASGGFQAGMGVACGDLDGDGLPDLAVTNFYGESTTLYRNLGGVFSDQSDAIGLTAASRSLLGFGIAMLDVNNDSSLDLATANGHVNDFRPTIPYAMPARLLAGDGGGRLHNVSEAAGPPWKIPRVGRGLAVGDLDNDGRLDLLIVALGAPLAYFHNQTAADHFVTFRLEGTTSNRDGVGARLTITSGGRRQVVQRVGGGSYLSASDPRLHLGLGSADRVESVEVAWPSGQVDLYQSLPADTAYRLREGHNEPQPLDGFPSGHRKD